MGKNKNKTKKYPKQNKRSNISLGFVKEALTLMGGLAGSILAIYGLVKTFKDDAEGFSWLIILGVGIWLYLLWRLFQVRKMTAYSLLIISVLVGVVGWVGWQSQVNATEKKFVVVVAKFDGPEEKYGLRRQMIEDLQDATKDYNDTEIMEIEELVTSSEYARELGMKVKADLVIWAWYRPTENPNITIHFENLSPTDFEVLQKSETYQPTATIADLETFAIQKKLGSETSTLVSFLSGYFGYQTGNYLQAINRFTQVLTADDISTYIDLPVLYFYLGNSHYELGEIDQAMESYNHAIELNPDYLFAYINRGVLYGEVGNLERAVEDLGKAVEIDPNSVSALMNRGIVYAHLGQYENALQDLDMAIAVNPNYPITYINRGNTYLDLKEYKKAIENFNMAINLNSEIPTTFNNRGIAYDRLGESNNAIRDYGTAISLDPDYAYAYVNRGMSYIDQGQYELAIEDFNVAIDLQPSLTVVYKYRGIAYKQLGKIIEAEADFKKYEKLTGEKP